MSNKIIVKGEPIYPDLIAPPGSEFKEAAKSNTADIYKESSDTAQDFALISAEEYKKRQQIFNPKEHVGAVKEVNNGQPVNPNDPYPVDKKITELEIHSPKVQVNSAGSDLESVKQTLLNMSVGTEQRIVQLENIVASMMRNLYRLSSRVNINCVYYGGQDVFNKYKCIRCLHHDLVNDTSVTLDQCLSCTRYEPIIGQIYDILGESEPNLNTILDNNQAAYMTMGDYVGFARIEEMHDEKKMANLAKNPAKTSKSLTEIWKDGFRMNWIDTPIDSQDPQISSYRYGKGPNYDAGQIKSEVMRLKSVSGVYTNNYVSAKAFNPSYHGSEASGELSDILASAQAYARQAAKVTVDNMVAHNYKTALEEECINVGVDPLLALALIATESTGNPDSANDYYAGLMQIPRKSELDPFNPRYNIMQGLAIYNAKRVAIKTDYPLFVLTAYNAGEGVILGTTEAPLIMDSWREIRSTDYKWSNFVPYLKRQVSTYFPSYSVTEKCEYFPRVMYCYNFLREELSNRGITLGSAASVTLGDTKYDNIFRFPFEVDDIAYITFTSDFGYRTNPISGSSQYHRGIDLAPTSARLNQGPVYLVSAENGIVLEAGVGSELGHFLKIQYGNYIAVYAHAQADSLLVSTGDSVVKGQKIAVCGTTGASTGVHLHFGVYTADKQELIDPKTMFSNLTSDMEGITLG